MLMSKYKSQIYAVLRTIAGFMFLCHGAQKLFNYPPMGVQLPWHIFIFGGGVEFVGGLLIMIGLFTRWAAFISSGEMAYAYWSSHGLTAILPLINRGELAILYCFLFLYIASKGSGLFSIDYLLENRKKELKENQ